MCRASKLRAIRHVGFTSINKPDVLIKIMC
jgi:hypothetical protein